LVKTSNQSATRLIIGQNLKPITTIGSINEFTKWKILRTPNVSMLGPMTDQADVHNREELLEFLKYSWKSSNKITHFHLQNKMTKLRIYRLRDAKDFVKYLYLNSFFKRRDYRRCINTSIFTQNCLYFSTTKKVLIGKSLKLATFYI